MGETQCIRNDKLLVFTTQIKTDLPFMGHTMRTDQIERVPLKENQY